MNVRNTTWGHTSVKLRQYWVTVFGEPAPSVEDIESALGDPSIMMDERSSDSKVVNGDMRALPALVCLWSKGENALYLPTHRAFDVMEACDAMLKGDYLKTFQNMKASEQQHRKEFRSRYHKKN